MADNRQQTTGERVTPVTWRGHARKVANHAIRIPGILLLRTIRALPLMQSRVIPWLLRQEIDQVPAYRKVAMMRQALKLATKGDGPILVGPWLSEVGYEVLYWLPFLRWALDDFGIPRERCVAVTRGGAGVWYADVASRSVDIFDLMTVEEFRPKNEARWMDRGSQKQMVPEDLDREILRRAKLALDLGKVPVLHPSIMYQLFRYYWYDKGSYGVLGKHMIYASLPPLAPDDAVRRGLPRDYVAVRFYFRDSFPDTPDNRDLVRRTIETIAAETPVVLLNTGLELDDHADFDPGTGAGIHRLDHLMTPSNNLAVQSHVVAGARGLVGTYGGLAYLGPSYGVPTVALYSHSEGLLAPHVDITHRLSNELGTPLVLLHTRDLDVVGTLVGVAGASRRVARTVSHT